MELPYEVVIDFRQATWMTRSCGGEALVAKTHSFAVIGPKYQPRSAQNEGCRENARCIPENDRNGAVLDGQGAAQVLPPGRRGRRYGRRLRAKPSPTRPAPSRVIESGSGTAVGVKL